MIVMKRVESLSIAELEGEILEPAFFTAEQKKMVAPLAIVSSNLAHKVTRNAKDLRSHTDRIYLLVRQQHATAVYNALVDLFLVLGSNGIAIRRRMLAYARTLLATHQFDILRQSLSSGLTTEVILPTIDQSLLNQGVSSLHQDFIQKRNIETVTLVSPIEQAMSYLEYGQIELAKSTLQEAIIANPGQLDLHNDLLEIFEKTKDKNNFSSVYKQLLNQHVVLPPRWREMAQSFGLEMKSK